jgi:ABC-type Fe3+ transport system substrate-binding protein
MKGLLPFAIPLALLLLGPILLEHQATSSRAANASGDTVVIITPHNEATLYEFARAFRQYHFARTGRDVFVDWRSAGGTSEIARYVDAQFLGSFRDYWQHTLHRDWTPGCAAFDDPKAATPDAIAARQAFLSSNAGCGIDLFFGGGSFDFIQMAAAGRLVDSGYVAAHPELFGTGPDQIPVSLNGEPLWDPKGCWIGACLSSFGICYNTDSLARLGIGMPPAEWSDLADPRYANEIALVDPTESGSVAKAFEMILQQQVAEAGGDVTRGWINGMRLIQRMAANARYFKDASPDIPLTVEAGDAAAGMTIDFYGRFESEAVRRPDGTSRLIYVPARGGSSTGADSIGLFRGAPHPALAREFIDFVLSTEGQKLWCLRAGTPGGPQKYTLRRLPILPSLYAPQWQPFEADPGVDPYAPAPGATFVYHPQWTASLFTVISFEIRTAFIDPHDELKAAWQALIQANFPPQATAAFCDLSAIDLPASSGAIRTALRSTDKLDSVVMARELDEHFRDQYHRAADLARQGL